MDVLIACEFSGIVRDAFDKKGHNAWSCDLIDTISPGYHIVGDVLDHLDDGWDLMIAHPPCKYLTVTANRSFLNNPERWKSRLDAMMFVHTLMNADIPKICVENPVGVISTHIRKPDQYIQPYEFGHTDSKKTGLWLKNLPLLKPTKICTPEWIFDKSGERYSKTHWCNSSTNNPKNAMIRSITYQGIADAMSSQWS
ncbi:DNA cytosine methyltransferase [Patescibacteria group bacterium]|nr:DNA cytosine methyltransferase [Patescibacteria group bacterium]